MQIYPGQTAQGLKFVKSNHRFDLSDPISISIIKFNSLALNMDDPEQTANPNHLGNVIKNRLRPILRPIDYAYIFS